jgi:putative Holliday junction resolvase
VRYLGLDVGDRRIGLAVSDETATLAGGLPTLERVGPKKDPNAVVELARRHEAGAIVVGLPKNLDGTIGPQAEKVLEFAEALKRRTPVPVVTWDERFTTRLAQQALIEGDVSRRKRKDVVDQVSAVLILQSYLDHLKAAEVALGGAAPSS